MSLLIFLLLFYFALFIMNLPTCFILRYFYQIPRLYKTPIKMSFRHDFRIIGYHLHALGLWGSLEAVLNLCSSGFDATLKCLQLGPFCFSLRVLCIRRHLKLLILPFYHVLPLHGGKLEHSIRSYPQVIE